MEIYNGINYNEMLLSRYEEVPLFQLQQLSRGSSILILKKLGDKLLT